MVEKITMPAFISTRQLYNIYYRKILIGSLVKNIQIISQNRILFVIETNERCNTNNWKQKYLKSEIDLTKEMFNSYSYLPSFSITPSDRFYYYQTKLGCSWKAANDDFVRRQYCDTVHEVHNAHMLW